MLLIRIKMSTTIIFFQKKVYIKINQNKLFLNECKLWMLYFDRNDVSEGTNVHRASASKECDICHY